MAGIATYHQHGRVLDTSFEGTFVLQVDTDNWTHKDTFSLVLNTDRKVIQVFSGMGIDDEGRVFHETNKNGRDMGVWWPTARKESDFRKILDYNKWERVRRTGFEGAKRFKLSDKYSLPVVAGYEREAGSIGQSSFDTIRFKGVDNKDLTFRVVFTQFQKDRFREQMENLKQ